MQRLSRKILSTSIVTVAMAGGAYADKLAVWSFNSGSTCAERLAASDAVPGVIVSGLTMNSLNGFGFRFSGVSKVPKDMHDGYGFGSNSDQEAIFIHRAEYNDRSPVPSPRPTVNDYTSFGLVSDQGTTAGLGNGHAPASFTVTAGVGKTVTVNSLTTYRTGGSANLNLAFQEAGAAAGKTVAIGQVEPATAYLTVPVVVENGATKTFTMSWNSSTMNSANVMDYFVLNGAVKDAGNPTPFLVGWSIAPSDGSVTVTATNLHVKVQRKRGRSCKLMIGPGGSKNS